MVCRQVKLAAPIWLCLVLWSLLLQIRPDHADLARALTKLVRIHAYDRLMAMTERTTEESSHGD